MQAQDVAQIAAEQEALLDSYRSSSEGLLERWRYRMRVVEAAPAYNKGDEVGEALFGETEDEAEDNAGSDESPLRWRRRGPAPPRPRGANNESEDTVGSAEAPPCRQRGGGFPPLRRGAARRQRDRGHRRLHRGPAPLPTRPRHTENKEE